MTRAKNNQGYTLIEALIYIVILVIIISAVIGFVIAMIKALDSLKSDRAINRGAQVALERIIRDIKSAQSINLSGSVFNSNPGQLLINSGSNTYNFSVANGRLLVSTNGGTGEALLPTGVKVSSLIFRRVVGPASESIRLELTLIHEQPASRVVKFYASAGLR